MREDVQRSRIRVLGSHWNRVKSRDVGTGVYWNKQKEKWTCQVVRDLGEYDTAAEAAQVLDKHLIGVENWFLDSLENGEMVDDIMGLKGIAGTPSSHFPESHMPSRNVPDKAKDE